MQDIQSLTRAPVTVGDCVGDVGDDVVGLVVGDVVGEVLGLVVGDVVGDAVGELDKAVEEEAPVLSSVMTSSRRRRPALASALTASGFTMIAATTSCVSSFVMQFPPSAPHGLKMIVTVVSPGELMVMSIVRRMTSTYERVYTESTLRYKRATLENTFSLKLVI